MLGIKRCYTLDFEPVKCPSCGGEDFQCEVHDIVAGHITEELYRCTGCGNPVAQWSYGCFEPQPRLVYAPNKALKGLINFFIKTGWLE
nr:MAG TPA: transcription factor IIS-like protein [Caudoviricetes sp.]